MALPAPSSIWLPTTCRPRGQSGGPGSGGGSVLVHGAVVGILGAARQRPRRAAAAPASPAPSPWLRIQDAHGVGPELIHRRQPGVVRVHLVRAADLRVRHEVRVQVGPDLQLVRAASARRSTALNAGRLSCEPSPENGMCGSTGSRPAALTLSIIVCRLVGRCRSVLLPARVVGAVADARRSGSRGSAPASRPGAPGRRSVISPPMPPLIIAGMYAFAVAVLIAAAKLGWLARARS